MNTFAPPYELHQLPSRTRSLPRLSRRAGFWAVAFAFLALTAFATAPSALYALYAQRDHLAPITLTVVYAVYAIGVVASLLLAGHLSDVYGRRAVLIPALLVAAAASIVFLAWSSLPGLLVARLLTGVALGAGVATATAYIADLDGAGDAPTPRSGIVATIANVGGLAVGPLLAGALAQYVPGGLTITFVVLLAALAAGAGLVARSPDGREPVRPRSSYRPQRLRAPADARGQFVAATLGGFLTFAVAGLLAGLGGRFLAGPLHHPSAVLTGLVIFLNFGAGVLVQSTTTKWPTHRLIAAGLAPLLIGLILLVVSAWTPTPSLALFLAGAVIAGLGSGAIIRGGLTVVLSTASPEERAGALATYFTAGYVGISLPVLGAGVALEFLSFRTTLLIFAGAVAAGILAAAPLLVRRPETRPSSLADELRRQTATIELAKRAGKEHNGTRLGTFLLILTWELEDDRDVLVALMSALRVRERLLPSARGLRRHRQADLDALQQGIDAKLDTWRSLRDDVGDRVNGIAVDELIHRAEEQAKALERRRAGQGY